MQLSSNRHYRHWLIKAPLGLSVIGFGICLISEAAMDKYAGVPTWDWVIAGTLALIVFNAGLCVFGDAIIHRVHYERERAATNDRSTSAPEVGPPPAARR